MELTLGRRSGELGGAPAARTAVTGAIGGAAITAARFAAVLGPARGEPAAFWRALFRQTYAAEFRVEQSGREEQILEHLLRKATAETVRAHLAGVDLGLLVQAIENGAMVVTGAQVSAIDVLSGLPPLGESDLYDQVCERLGATNDGQRAGAIELALEGLYLARKIGKDSDGSETVYG